LLAGKKYNGFISMVLGVVHEGVECEYLPGIFTRLTDLNILQFVKSASGSAHSKLLKMFPVCYFFNTSSILRKSHWTKTFVTQKQNIFSHYFIKQAFLSFCFL